MKTKILTLALAVLTIGLLGSCKKEDPKISVTCVSLDKTELTITVGDPDVKLTATVAPENATDKSVNWSSNAESVATVDQEGNVTAVAPGYATITVTTVDGGMTATCDVKVKAALPAGALAGEFSVSATKKVHFSQGNLYWDGNAFKFETNQYDVQTNWNASHVSHFAWCKTASEACEESYSESGTTAGDVFFTNATTETPNAVFTVNGETGKYRTLSKDEWTYLFNTRTVIGGTGKDRSYSLNITYGGKLGLVLYPDNYAGSILSGTVKSLPEGVVFLPAAGSRKGSNISNNGNLSNCWYWSSSALDSEYAYRMIVDMGYVYPAGGLRYLGFSVRLVTDVK